jgi:hypothetical protein
LVRSGYMPRARAYCDEGPVKTKRGGASPPRVLQQVHRPNNLTSTAESISPASAIRLDTSLRGHGRGPKRRRRLRGSFFLPAHHVGACVTRTAATLLKDGPREFRSTRWQAMQFWYSSSWATAVPLGSHRASAQEQDRFHVLALIVRGGRLPSMDDGVPPR